MAQGAFKPKSGTATKSKPPHSAKQKQKNTGHKVIKSKNLKKAQHREMARKGAAGLTGNLEKQLAQRAGYTEMIAAKEGKRKGAVGLTKEKQGKEQRKGHS